MDDAQGNVHSVTQAMGRRIKRLAAGLMLLLPLNAGAQTDARQNFPVKPVRMLVPFSVGGQPDSVARIISPKLAEVWKQPVVVENRRARAARWGLPWLRRQCPMVIR